MARSVKLTGEIDFVRQEPDGSVCVACDCGCYIDMYYICLRVLANGKEIDIQCTEDALCGSCVEVIGQYEYGVES